MVDEKKVFVILDKSKGRLEIKITRELVKDVVLKNDAINRSIEDFKDTC